MKSKERLDLLLVNKGFFTSREKARRYIMTGDVLVDDVPIDKPGTKVNLTAAIRLRLFAMSVVVGSNWKKG